MKGSLIILALFASGIGIGMTGTVPESFLHTSPAKWLLYALAAQIGISIGYSGNLRKTFGKVTLRSLSLPLGTMIGTLFMSALAGLCLGRFALTDYLAVGSGLGYYSLSSVLIIDLKSDTAGIQTATQLGMLAMLTNIIREMTALIGGPWFARLCGRYAPTAAAGVTSMDVTLPMIIRCSGQELFPVALMHGMVLEICVPVLVTIFASL